MMDKKNITDYSKKIGFRKDLTNAIARKWKAVVILFRAAAIKLEAAVILMKAAAMRTMRTVMTIRTVMSLRVK